MSSSSSSNSAALFDMEMERLDSEIEKSRKQFYSAVLGKKRKVKRTWLEISSLTNAHILQMLPYKAMLGHVAKLADERDKLISEILAAKQKERESEEMEARGSGGGGGDIDVEDADDDLGLGAVSTMPRNSISSEASSQTEESSFHNVD